MTIHHLHHVHIFASDIDKSTAFYQNNFDGEIVLDAELAGARNVFMRIGEGRIHLYDQPPKVPGRGSIHHFGIQTQNIEETVSRLKKNGVVFQKQIRDFEVWKYIMVLAPDDVLIELFEVNKEKIPSEFWDYFV